MAMKTIDDLRKELLSMFSEIKDGTADVKAASEMNNTAGKIINSVKVELEYAVLRETEPSIPFLEYKK